MTMRVGGTLELACRPRAWLAQGFLIVTLAWMLMLVTVPLLLAHETGGRAVTATSAGTYLVGSIICHQRPDRSFRLRGVQMPVCARCAGLYLGATVGVLLAGAGVPFRRLADGCSGILHVVLDVTSSQYTALRRRNPAGCGVGSTPPVEIPGLEAGRESPLGNSMSGGGRMTASGSSPSLRLMVLAAAGPTGVTWLAEAVGWLPYADGLRAVAAVPLGVAVTWVAILVIRGELA